ncbi:Zn-ribbon domain-containing OB-fold protein [Pacificimonas sp. ICDLI1SI03]
MATSYLRTLPAIDNANRAFWTGGAEGKLMISCCGDCGTWTHPPGPVCPKCLSDNVAPQPTSGRASVETYTVNYRAWGPGMDVPYVIAIVILDEQPDVRLTTNIVGIDAEAVTIGMRVAVRFENDEDVWLPQFAPLD